MKTDPQREMPRRTAGIPGIDSRLAHRLDTPPAGRNLALALRFSAHIKAIPPQPKVVDNVAKSERVTRKKVEGWEISLEMWSLVQPLAGMPTIEYNIPSAPKDLQNASVPALSVILSKPARRKGNFPGLE